MAQERPVTPEKQLLKLIEDPKAKGAGAQSYAARHRLSFFSLAAWKSRLSFLKGNLRKGAKTGRFQRLDTKTVNKFLCLLIFSLGAYFITDLYISMVNFKKMPNLKFEIQKSLKSEILPEVSVLRKKVAYYLEKVRDRDIFNMGIKQVVEEISEVEHKPKLPTSKIMDAVQNLKLVGISWSDDPDAMIEDTKAMRTFFVKRGQMIGDIKVQAIFKDKVILGYAGEEMELK
ncbi:MAG: hypothetical protein KJ957_01620 [Candidatus Omnitrophica bacterium]|nr:hypothetical protein [Candidatus Omnitrophota bacterium]MBU1852728.1 hypothetical protein [Candidatus Omnitrophota bacterium]